MEVKESHAVIMGGASGIGSGICRALAARGAIIDICDRDAAGAEALAVELRASGAEAEAYEVDVTDEATVRRAAAEIRALRGRTDLLFANAGGIILKPLLQTTVDDWRWIMEVNLIGCVITVRTFLPGMLAQDAPSRIAVTSSVAALRVPDLDGQTMYTASKTAQLGFCNALRRELAGSLVGLSVILPGRVASQLRAKSEQARPGSVQVRVPTTGPDGAAMSPEEAGERILCGIAADQDHITTHPGEGHLVRKAQDAIMQAFENA